jgi:hypothetical protein
MVELGLVVEESWEDIEFELAVIVELWSEGLVAELGVVTMIDDESVVNADVVDEETKEEETLLDEVWRETAEVVLVGFVKVW